MSIKKIIKLKKTDIEKIRKATKRNVSNLLSVYAFLLKHPILEVKDICNFLSLSKPTANNLLETLTELGILELLEDKKRYKQYVYKEYVDILSEGTSLD